MENDIILANVHAVDPQVGLDGIVDVRIADGRIAAVGAGLAAAAAASAAFEDSADGADVRDLSGHVLVPGLVDMHVHLRDPGQEHKETIATGTRAAARGGFTGVCSMPNTDPVCDRAVIVDYVQLQARATGSCRVYPAGACTQGLAGEVLAEMGDMVAHGAVAFTDDGRGIQSAGMMRRVMDYARPFDRVVMPHCQDASLVGDGQINEGAVSTRLGLQGWPAEGEELEIARDIALCRLTGCPLHIQHISTGRGLDLVRAAKAEGLPVTCEVAPHHLFLADEDIDESYNTNFKVNPPLRTRADNAALQEGVLDGSIDAWVTDHAPHAEYEKDREFELAPFGMTGLETSLALAITELVAPGRMSWARLVELMAVNPRRILRLPEQRIEEGAVADLTVIDPAVQWTVDPADFASKAKNSAFIGRALTGRASDVFVGGRQTLRNGVLL